MRFVTSLFLSLGPMPAIGCVATLMAAGLSGCSVGMPSAAAAPAFTTSSSSNSRASLGGPLAARNSNSNTPGRTVIAAEGDTLMSIGRRYNVPMSVLLDHNTLRSLTLIPGTEIFVPQLQPSYRR
jgi:LysM repeat protein